MTEELRALCYVNNTPEGRRRLSLYLEEDEASMIYPLLGLKPSSLRIVKFYKGEYLLSTKIYLDKELILDLYIDRNFLVNIKRNLLVFLGQGKFLIWNYINKIIKFIRNKTC